MKKLKMSLSLLSMGLFLTNLSALDKPSSVEQKDCSNCCKNCVSKENDPFLQEIDSFLEDFDKKELKLAQVSIDSGFLPSPEQPRSLLKEEKIEAFDPSVSRAQKHQRAEAHAQLKQQGSIPSNSKIQYETHKPRPGVPIVQTTQPLKEIAETETKTPLAPTSNKDVVSSTPTAPAKDYGNPGYNMPELSINRRGANVILSGSFIYWKPEQDNFDVGITGPRPSSGQQVKSFHSQYEPGFKAELGVNSSYDNWTLCLEYTQLRTSQSNESGSSVKHPVILSPWVSLIEDDQNLYNPFNATSAEILQSGVKNYWRFNFEMLDLVLSRSYYVGKKLIFNPFLAARGAKINQTLKVDFTYTTRGASRTQNSAYSYNKNHTQQIGPRFGLDMNWLIGSSFRFGGTAAGALLYTGYHLRHTEVLNNSSHANIYSNPHSFRLNFDAALEFGWRAYFSRHRRYVDCSFKYEAIVFCDQNRLAGLSSLTTNQGRVLDSGNLYLHGGTFKLEFNF